VDPIEIECTESPILRSRTYGLFVVSRPLELLIGIEHSVSQVHGLATIYNLSYQKYEQLSADYEQLRQMVMDMRSQMGGTCALSFWSYGPGNDQPPPPSPPAPPLL
jgi:hypothetical protein